jgi:hypothetical protein
VLNLLAQASEASGSASVVEFARENSFWVIMGTIAITSIVAGCIKSVVKHASRERSRREIAAYIAEGSMTPEQGEKLMNAGDRRTC